MYVWMVSLLVEYNPDFRFKERVLFRKGADGIPKRMGNGGVQVLIFPGDMVVGKRADGGRPDSDNQERED